METFITIVIAIAIFGFQAYANYQKEQDKARKRNPAQPPLPEDNAKYIQHGPAGDSTPAAAPVTSSAATSEFERYSGMMDSSEFTRDEHQRPSIPQRLVVDTDTDTQPVLLAEEFDLRDAVIKSIILERPYK
ncbi:hypothetical protein [Parapedobacter sp.]